MQHQSRQGHVATLHLRRIGAVTPSELAFDLGDYEGAIKLYEEANTRGLKFGTATEMRPFIKSAAFSGDWDKALDWSATANNVNPNRTTGYFANLWQILDRDVPDSPEKTDAMTKAHEIFGSAK